jgi:hypothetical protein
MEYISTVPGEGGGLSDSLVSDFRMNDSMRLRPKGFNNAEGLSSLRWVDISRCYSDGQQFNCSTRRNGVEYSTPDWAGFNFQWGWFEDDDWGAAARYKNTFADTWMLTANVAYENFRDERLQNGGGGEATGPIIIPPSSTKTTFFQRNLDEWAGSAAVKHKPSGLFAMANFSTSESGDTNVRGFYTGNGAPDMTAWDVQAGIQKKWWSPGETAFWGGYAQVNDGWAPGSNGNGGNLGGISADSILKPFTFASVGVPTEVVGSEVDRWFLAFDQSIEAAAMHLYVAYEHFNADMDLVTRDASVSPTGKLKNVPVSIDDFDVIYTGGRIYF